MKQNTDRRLILVKDPIFSHYDGAFTREQFNEIIDIDMAAVTDAVGEVKIEVELEERWDGYVDKPSYKAVLQLRYNRYENDQEYNNRLSQQTKLKEQREAHEKAEWERLKKQFGG